MHAGPWTRFIIWRHNRRRAEKLLRRIRTADAAVVSVGKSGRTWLRAMLSHVYHQRYGVPESELINFDNFNARHVAIPRILFTGVGSGALAPSGRTWGEELSALSHVDDRNEYAHWQSNVCIRFTWMPRTSRGMT